MPCTVKGGICINGDGRKDEKKFYKPLQEVLDNVPSYDIKLVIGDYNATIGQRQHGME